MDTSLPFLAGKNPFDVHVYFGFNHTKAATLKRKLMIDSIGSKRGGRQSRSYLSSAANV